MKPHEVTTGNGQSPVAPPLAPSGRFLDAVSVRKVNGSFFILHLFKNKKEISRLGQVVQPQQRVSFKTRPKRYFVERYGKQVTQ
jgi:hypothetical protein